MRTLILRSFIGAMLAIATLCAMFSVVPSALAQGEGTALDSAAVSPAADGEILSYPDYIAQYAGAERPAQQIVLSAGAVSETDEKTELLDIQGQKALVTGEDGYIQWEAQVPQTGLYQLQITYCNVPGKGSAIERELLIDGVLPFTQAGYLSFSRSFRDKESKLKTDADGNEIRPEHEETISYKTVFVQDPLGYQSSPLQFYLTEGTHRVRLSSIRENMAVAELRFCQARELPSYEEYRTLYPDTPGTDQLYLEAEQGTERSDFSIYAYNDRSSAFTVPQDAYRIRLNAIGGNKWQTSGQWISWNIHVDSPGLYQIVLRCRQNIRNGSYVVRKLYLDGEIPFMEAANLRFPYHSAWRSVALADRQGQPYYFYLSEGSHTLRLEVALGDFAEILGEVDSSILTLNEIYRSILMITGPTPDLFRDYSFEAAIPEVLVKIGQQASVLRDVSKRLIKAVGVKGEDTAIIDKLVFQLETMKKDPDKIPRLFTDFQSNISALGTWVLTARQQPLELDSIRLVPAGQRVEPKDKGFFKQLNFSVQTFLSSFISDYNSVRTDGQVRSTVEVWLATGRDQAQIINSLANSYFTGESGIGVNLKLVGTGTLLPSVLAGIGPDVSLFNVCTDPVNYATRKAVKDLSQFDGFEAVIRRFVPESLIPYQYQGGTYALPETVNFPMMFYRKDIFEQLRLEIPKTWTEFYAIIPEIQKRNMQIGFPATLTGLQTLLYQKGGSLYNKNLTASSFGDAKTLDAFDELAELFTVYRFPVQYDFANRFRTGEVPLAIIDYVMYNQLTVYAPEIKGLWEFVPLPSPDSAEEPGAAPVISVGMSPSTGVMLLRDAGDPQAAWKFISWWTSDDTQYRFCTEMEAVLGASAKQPTANVNVISRLPWTASEYRNLEKQFGNLAGTPEVPGGYYISRYFEFAFNDVYSNSEPSARALMKYVQDVNDEIARKRKEFGIVEP